MFLVAPGFFKRGLIPLLHIGQRQYVLHIFTGCVGRPLVLVEHAAISALDQLLGWYVVGSNS